MWRFSKCKRVIEDLAAASKIEARSLVLFSLPTDAHAQL
jgi:hypothetical protein